MILLNILCRYWYIYFNVTDKNIFLFFFVEQELIRHACGVYLSLSLLSPYFSLTLVMLIWLPLGSRLQNWERALCKVFLQGGGGWGKALNKFLYEEALPRAPTPYSYPFMYHFSQKRYPFHVPSINKWYPFHIPCLELCIPFNCCKCTVF